MSIAFGGQYSIQLSYECVAVRIIPMSPTGVHGGALFAILHEGAKPVECQVKRYMAGKCVNFFEQAIALCPGRP
jgi:hypothetical protein